MAVGPGAGPTVPAREGGGTIETTDTAKRHPPHALYLGRSHGEVGALALRARVAREGAAAGHGSAATDHGAATLPAGLGLAAAAVAAARLPAKLTGRE